MLFRVCHRTKSAQIRVWDGLELGARPILALPSHHPDFFGSHRDNFEVRYLETGTLVFLKISGRLTWYIYRRFGPVFRPEGALRW